MKPLEPSNMGEASSPDESAHLADIFAFLALLMRYPEDTFFDDEFLDTLESLLIRLNLHQLHQKITVWRASVADPLLDAQIEYTRLFINTAPHLVAPPFGSVYLEGDKSLQGKSTEKTRDFYRQYGFDIVNAAEPADHIFLELEFLSCLYRQGEDEAADTFSRTLLLPWFYQFSQKITPELRHPFFEVSIQLITLFVKEDH